MEISTASNHSRQGEERERVDAATAGDLALLVEGLPDGILLIDPEWRISYANATARRISHLQPDQIQAETLWDLYPEILGTPIERAYREVAALGQPRQVPPFLYEPFQAWFEMSILPMRRGVAVHYRDVTALHESEEAHRASESQLQQALEATTDGVASVDREWRITYLNPRAREILSARSDVVGTDLWESFPGALYDGSPYVDHYYRAMEEHIPGEFEAFYPEPLNIWVHVMVRPAKSGIFVFFREITKQKRAAASLIETEKLAAVGRLASSIAHEINNPLEAVTNLIYLARQSAVNLEAQQYLDMAEQELRRVSNIAIQTLRFHKQTSRPQTVGCADLFSTTLSVYEGRFKNSGIVIEKRKRAQRPIVCYEGEIRQVLNNLVSNAIDAMPSGGRLLIRSREATDSKSAREGLVLTVADTGCGISEATRSRLFEAFYSTKGIGGTGLGLWISAEIIKRHEGRISIRSSQRPDHHGTVICIFLPFETRPVAAASR